MIREANFLDIPDLVKIGKELYDAAINHKYSWNDERAIEACKYFMSSSDSMIIVGIQHEQIAGFFIGELYRPIASNDIVANDVMIFVRPEFQGGKIALKLIKKYEAWAKEKGAKFINLGVSSGLKQNRTLSMYELLGYRPHSVSYIKEV